MTDLHSLTRHAALREARKMFGPHAATYDSGLPRNDCRRIGVKIGGRFYSRGVGATWELALFDAAENAAQEGGQS